MGRQGDAFDLVEEAYYRYMAPMSETEIVSYQYKVVANKFAKEKDYPRAWEIIEKGRKICPNSTQVRFGMGNFANSEGYDIAKEGRYREAIGHYHKAIALDSMTLWAANNMAYAFTRLGERDSARYYLDVAWERLGEKHGSIGLYYHFRNCAVYHQAHGKDQLVDEFYDQLTSKTLSNGQREWKKQVDLLDYHFAIWCFEQGKEDIGKLHLKKAKEAGEREAVKLWDEMYPSID